MGSVTNGAVFSAIYESKIWGLSTDHSRPFFSGSGSSDRETVEPYVAVVAEFFSRFPRKMSAVDIGCGDFRVGSRLVDSFSEYTACDVVEELIEFNQVHYRTNRGILLCHPIKLGFSIKGFENHQSQTSLVRGCCQDQFLNVH